MLIKKILFFSQNEFPSESNKGIIEVNDNFSEAWKLFMALTRTCPHHDIPSWELVRIFYGVLNDINRIWLIFLGAILLWRTM